MPISGIKHLPFSRIGLKTVGQYGYRGLGRSGNLVVVGITVDGAYCIQMKAKTRQVGGTHYSSRKIQPWDVMAEYMNPEEFSGFLRGNVIKYILRYKDKDGKQDLLKAQHYLERLIELASTEMKEEVR